MEFQAILQSNKVYTYRDIDTVIEMAFEGAVVSRKPNVKLSYYDVPCSFDIETSSFYSGKNKRGCMYLWSLCLNGAVVLGRTWQQAVTCFEHISKALKLSGSLRLIIYVHNLGYEFQWMRKYFEWKKVFSLSMRKPVYAITESNIEFRCSYLLSGYNLANLGKQLQKYKVKKLVGDLDYSLVRHSSTFLTGKELAYSVNDVKVVAAYIKEQIEIEKGLANIPITKTGYVRRFCRNNCFFTAGVPRKKSFKKLKYMDMMAGLTLDPDEYKQLKRAFQGGFTHGNIFYSGYTLKKVDSVDFTSSYPAQLCAKEYPMSKAEVYHPEDQKDFEKQLRLYCCLFDVHLVNVRPKIYYENYLSLSRCWGIKGFKINNGRVVSASELYTTVTEQDWQLIDLFYDYDEMQIANFKRYKKAYLPTSLVKSILTLYQDKTQLKNVAGREVDYLLAKGMLNACYGMCVTDIVRPEIKYGSEWAEMPVDIEKEIMKYNRSSSRFLYYPWGVWCTAYSRAALFSGILSVGAEDYVYSDTDSIKLMNMEGHMDYINAYNAKITKELERAMDYHKLPYDLIRPKTIKGVEKPLGVWDIEEGYDRFKFLGAKRYMVEQDGNINITVSGLNKRVTVPYLTASGNDAAFESFDNNLYVPPEYTGKNTHTYIDEEIAGVFTDYLGREGEYHEQSFVHLEAADYNLGLAQEYVDYILSIREVEI